MRKQLLLLLSIITISIATVSSQCVYDGTANAGNDVTICAGQSVTLTGSYTSLPGSDTYTFQSIAYNPQPFAGTSLTMGDDVISSVLPIGFTFCFFGTPYTNCYIGSNGWVGFTYNNAWTTFITAPIPSTQNAVPKNCIMGPWSDWYPPGGGTIKYQTTGTAPNRRFVATWQSVPLYPANGCPTGTFQIVLNETTNTVENYIQSKPICNQYNWTLYATQGVHNLAGTVGYTVPGRNNTNWTVTTPEGNLFQPTGAPNVQVTWWSGGVQVGTGNTLTVSPSSTTTYTIHVLYTCSNTLYCDDVTVTVNPGITSAPTTITQAWCNPNDNGTATVNAVGGNTPYTYLWNAAAGNQTTQTATGLTAGTYTVTITTADGCTATATATVTSVPNTINAASSSTLAWCSPNDNGTATVTPSGGTSPYTYQWDAAAGNQTTQTATNLVAGNYSVTITDVYGCTFGVTVNVGSPASVPTFAFSSITNVLCFGDSSGGVNVTVFGGTPPLVFVWSSGHMTEDIAGIPAGTYGVTVTDSYGCSANASYDVTTPPNIIDGTITTTDVNCFGGSDGSATANPVGGTSPYLYDWSTTETTQTILNLSGGIVTVTITDDNGCVAIINDTINEPAAALALSTVLTMVNCFGGNDGAIDLTATGGTLPYSFNWSNLQVTEDIAGLSTGVYDVTVTDANGCTSTANALITEPASGISLSTTVTDVGCFGGTNGAIDLTISGGTPAYTIVWSNAAVTEDLIGIVAGNYTATVTDNNGCTSTTSATVNQPAANMFSSTVVTDVDCFGDNTGAIDLTVNGGTMPLTYAWSNAAVTQDINNVSAGVYDVTITDANGCAITATATVAEPASAVSVSMNSTDVTCYQGSDGLAGVTASGGTSGYTYSWSNGNTTNNISGLVIGNYSVTVSDANGCTATGSVTLSEPSALIFDVTNLYTIQLGESATVELLNSSPGIVSYLWTPSSDLDDATIATPTATPSVTTTYNVIVTDVDGCTQTNWVTITVENPNIPFIPKGFTPNGDGMNDFLYVYGNTIESLEFVIYNRWGEQLFFSSTVGEGWDGTYRGSPVTPGVYVYYFTATTVGGFEYVNKGDVTVIR